MTKEEISQLDLPNEIFERWWGHLDRQDRDEFKTIYGGDDILARFVCALDYLSMQKTPVKDLEELCTISFYLAVRIFEPEIDYATRGTKNRAIRAWKHDATQALFDRVKYRTARQAAMRLQTKLFELANLMADDAMKSGDYQAQKAAADVLFKATKMVSEEETAVRAERTKRGLERARESLEGGGEEISLREMKALIGAAKDQHGSEAVEALIKE